MSATVSSNSDGSLTVSFTFTPANSILEGEERLRTALNDAGNLATHDSGGAEALLAKMEGALPSALIKTTDHWEQFWHKVSRFGFCQIRGPHSTN